MLWHVDRDSANNAYGHGRVEMKKCRPRQGLPQEDYQRHDFAFMREVPARALLPLLCRSRYAEARNSQPRRFFFYAQRTPSTIYFAMRAKALGGDEKAYRRSRRRCPMFSLHLSRPRMQRAELQPWRRYGAHFGAAPRRRRNTAGLSTKAVCRQEPIGRRLTGALANSRCPADGREGARLSDATFTAARAARRVARRHGERAVQACAESFLAAASRFGASAEGFARQPDMTLLIHIFSRYCSATSAHGESDD